MLVESRHFPNKLPGSPRYLDTPQWEANEATLARHLDDETWDALSPFMRSMVPTRVMIEASPPNARITVGLLKALQTLPPLAESIYKQLTDGDDVRTYKAGRAPRPLTHGVTPSITVGGKLEAWRGAADRRSRRPMPDLPT
jgi:hypothetical protein